jgi:hypothetical protein
MNMRNLLWVVTLIGAGAAACGGGGSSKPPTVADFCTQKATAECQVTASCGANPTMADCLAQRAAICTAYAGAIASPRAFTPANIGKCINITKSVYAKTTAITPTDLSMVDDACNYVFQGPVEKNAPCTVKYDCTGSLVCDKGKCATLANKNKGDQCMDFGAICVAGSYCAPDINGVLTCTAKGGQGATCDAATPCLESLRCTGGKCADRVPAGGACVSSNDCAIPSAPYCDTFAGNLCDTGLMFAPGSPSCTGFINSGVTAGTGNGGGGGGTGGTDGGAGGSDGAAADAAGG